MSLGLTIGVSATLFVILLLAFILGVTKVVVNNLRKRGRAEIDTRFAGSDVLMSETLAQSFGIQSKGPAQLRGNGALALTKDELCFVMYVPTSELRIPVTGIIEVTMPRSHLGKTQGAQLLHVRYTLAGAEDAIAWRVPSPESWKAKIESLRS